MEIIVGNYSGFCNGVSYTINTANKLLNEHDAIYSLGELVHNKIVMDNLKNKGLIVKENIDEIPNQAKVIIRAHGEKVETYRQAKEKDMEIYDLTCGRVKVIHNKILNKKDDCFIIVIGKKVHPETIAHATYSDNSFVIEDNSDINDAYNAFKLSNLNKVYIVVQTTFNKDKFDLLCEEIKKVFNTEIIIDNTICNATALRQEEARKLAKTVDKMIVIGDKNSSNTKELANVSKEYCNTVYLIETVKELNKDMFNNDDVIGVMAGASTPNEVIDETVEFLNSFNYFSRQ